MQQVALVEHTGQDEHELWLCTFGIGERGGWGVHRHEQHQFAWVSSGTCCPLAWDQPSEVEVGRLVRELLLHIGRPGPGGRVPREYAIVLFDQLGRPSPPIRPTLPMPSDPRAADVARAILADPACPHTLDDWATAVAASPSTLRRAFLAETSLTFSEWRARVRLDAAGPLLASGMRPEQVALRVGYASRSGFVDAYLRQFGHAPATA